MMAVRIVAAVVLLQRWSGKLANLAYHQARRSRTHVSKVNRGFLSASIPHALRASKSTEVGRTIVCDAGPCILGDWIHSDD